MIKKAMQIISLGLLLSSCVVNHKYSKSKSPIDITSECLVSTIKGNSQYTQFEKKNDFVSFEIEGIKLTAAYSEKALIISAADERIYAWTKSTETENVENKLIYVTDHVWQHIADTCQK